MVMSSDDGSDGQLTSLLESLNFLLFDVKKCLALQPKADIAEPSLCVCDGVCEYRASNSAPHSSRRTVRKSPR